MNRLKGLSGDKLRGFFTDLYADLRDRRLLPLVALLIVGIIAAPILLKDKGEEAPPPPPIAAASPANAASFTVASEKKTLRSYQKRLADRTPQDPFEPQVAEGSNGKKEESSGSSGETGGVVEPSSEESGSVTVTEETTTVQTKPGPVRYVPVPVTFGVDVRVRTSTRAHNEPAVRPQSKLPSSKNPVVVYVGRSKDKKHALFLPSSQVLGYTGPVHCAAEKASCQLLEVGLGAPVNYLYGGKEKHLILTVKRFVPILQLPNGKERVVSTQE